MDSWVQDGFLDSQWIFGRPACLTALLKSVFLFHTMASVFLEDTHVCLRLTGMLNFCSSQKHAPCFLGSFTRLAALLKPVLFFREVAPWKHEVPLTLGTLLRKPYLHLDSSHSHLLDKCKERSRKVSMKDVSFY